MSKIVSYEACPKCRRNGRDGRGDNLARYADGGAHCFSCKHHEWPKHYIPKKVEDNVPKGLLPSDFSREVPARAWEWLLSYGLPLSHWKPHCGYSEKDHRLVFTVGTPMQFSIGRFVGASSPNEQPPRKWFVWGDCHKHAELVQPSRETRNSSVVLVEDLISAHKVAAAGFTSLPLFGTNIFPSALYYLMTSDEDVVLWLDKDQENLVKRKAMGLEGLIGRHVKTITTDKDPKSLSFNEIKETLNV